MHPVMGTMMPEICEAPHPAFQPLPRRSSNSWDAFISFSLFIFILFGMINLTKHRDDLLYLLVFTQRSNQRIGVVLHHIDIGWCRPRCARERI